MNISKGESGGMRLDLTVPNATKVLAALVVFEDAGGAVRQCMRLGQTSYSIGECIGFLVQAVIECIGKHRKERINDYTTRVGFLES